MHIFYYLVNSGPWHRIHQVKSEANRMTHSVAAHHVN